MAGISSGTTIKYFTKTGSELLASNSISYSEYPNIIAVVHSSGSSGGVAPMFYVNSSYWKFEFLKGTATYRVYYF